MGTDVAVSIDSEQQELDDATKKAIAAVADRRENGGTREQVRSAALKLISCVCRNLDEVEDDD